MLFFCSGTFLVIVVPVGCFFLKSDRVVAGIYFSFQTKDHKKRPSSRKATEPPLVSAVESIPG